MMVERPKPPGIPDDEREDAPPSPLERPVEEDDEVPSEDESSRATIPEPIAELRERLAAEAARTEALQREVAFLAAGQRQGPQEPAPDPVREAMNLFRIDPQTWNEMIADPRRGAELATNALQSAVLVGSHLSQAQQQAVLQQVQQQLHAHQAQTNITREGDDMKRLFWERNQNLLPYERLVRQFASEVASEVNQGRAYTSEQVLHEIGSRTRAELRANYNTDIPEPTGGRRARVASMEGARERLRPAGAEMGSSLGRHAPPMSAVQKSLYRLARR